MNKVLITGLGVGKSLHVCDCCNLDYSWLGMNPSTLIWADKICIPQKAYNAQLDEKGKASKAINLVLEMANKNGILDIVNISDMYQDCVGEQIYSAVKRDTNALLANFPQNIGMGREGVPDQILIEGEEYCGPYLASIYASIRVARDLGANCLFDKRVYHFLKYRYGLEMVTQTKQLERDIYNEIFNVFIPNESPIPKYAFENDEKCSECAYEDKCEGEYLEILEKNLREIFRWRQYDEIYQAREEIDKIVAIKGQITNEKQIKEVIREFEDRKEKINVNLHKRFPKVKRWTNLVTVMATPFTLCSALNGNLEATAVSAAASAVSIAVEKAVEIYETQNSWVGFFDKNN